MHSARAGLIYSSLDASLLRSESMTKKHVLLRPLLVIMVRVCLASLSGADVCACSNQETHSLTRLVPTESKPSH